jgi:hypothetical protein
MKSFLAICGLLCCLLFVTSEVEVFRIFDYRDSFVNQTVTGDNNIALPPHGKYDRKIPYDVFVVPKAYYWHQFPYTIITDERNRVIESASGHTHGLFDPHIFRNPEVKFGQHKNRTLHGNLLLVRSSCHYWHFHYEVLSQLMFFHKAGIFERFEGQKNYVNIIPCIYHAGVYREIMEFYGFRWLFKSWTGMEISAHKGMGYHFAPGYSLITATNTGVAGYLPINVTARFMNEKAMENYRNTEGHFHPSNPNDLSYLHRRIFIGRDDKEGSRGILNFREVEAILKEYDIYYFNPGVDASYAKQMYVFSHAELVIGVSGTGFSTNIAFCHIDSTILIELVPPKVKTFTGQFVADALRFKYYFPLKIGYNATKKDSRDASFYLDVTKLDDFLYEALASQRKIRR